MTTKTENKRTSDCARNVLAGEMGVGGGGGVTNKCKGKLHRNKWRQFLFEESNIFISCLRGRFLIKLLVGKKKKKRCLVKRLMQSLVNDGKVPSCFPFGSPLLC